MDDPRDEITPPAIYFNRRALLRGGALAASAAATGAIYRAVNRVGSEATSTMELDSVVAAEGRADLGFRVEGEAMTPLSLVANYNNFYEFSTDKEAVAAK